MRRRPERSRPRRASNDATTSSRGRSAIHAGDGGVDLVDVRCAAGAGLEPRLAREVRSADERSARSAIDVALAETATHWSSAVRYDVARRIVARAVARARAVAEQVVRRRLRAEQGQERLDERRVDYLAAPRLLACAQRKHDRVRSRERRHAVGEREGRSRGGPSGSPFSAANPLIASASVPKPGRRLYGPDWPSR